jgi:hypothetical protein
VPRLADDPTDEQIDAALERMAFLLGQDFVESCEKEIIKENDIGKRRSTAAQPPADQPGAGKRV